jgi:hypothetical protein
MSYRFVDSCRAGSGWDCSSILILLLEILKVTVTVVEHDIHTSTGTCYKYLQHKPVYKFVIPALYALV